MSHSPKEPIFVGGSGRCGTTILANTLGLHSRIFTFPDELRFLSAGTENLIDWMHSPHSPHLRRVMCQGLRGGFLSRAAVRDLVRNPRGASWRALYRKLAKGSYYSRPVARNEREVGLCRAVEPDAYKRAVDRFLRQFPADSIRERRQQIRDFTTECAESALQRVGAARWCDGTPDTVLHMLDLAGIFPGAKFIHIIRDGRDVARSFYRLGWSPSTTAALRQWHQAVATGRVLGSELGPSQYLEVQFERLLDDPRGSIGKVIDFLGEAWDDALGNHDISKSAVTKPEYAMDPDFERLFRVLSSGFASEIG